MAEKAFNKKLQKRCEYCVFGNLLENSNDVACKKKGITAKDDRCRHYKYDPLKRKPASLKISDNYKPEDFEI